MQYPDLSKSKIISIDIETYDPDLKTLGPSVYRDPGGFILGVALADENGFAEYYNLGHYDCSREEYRKNIDYLKKTLAANNKKLGMSLRYDIDWLENWLELKVNGQLYDIEIAEALIDETQGHYSLDFMSLKYLDQGKFVNEIDQFCLDNNLKGDSRQWLWKMPYKLVRKYAVTDVRNPLAIFKKQWRILYSEDLLDLLHLECDLIRCLLLMRKNGVRIDPDRRDRNALKLQNMLEEKRIQVYREYNEFNYNSSQQIAHLLNGLKIDYPLTNKGNPSINADWLKANTQYPLVKNVYTLRKIDKTINTFLLGSFVRFMTKGDLIHCSFYNMRTEEYGTRSGRLSSALPNLQQIPGDTDKFYGILCREVFIPFEDCDWCKLDYSQIEYRFMAHFASGLGSEEIVKAYRKEPKTDYHKYIMDITGLRRKPAKNLNFAIPYGMGVATMSRKFRWEEDYCRNLLKTYHRNVPFMKKTIKKVEETAIRRGYIKTILDRRSRLKDKDKAYIMFCRLIQGSAADLMKKAMVDCYKAGTFTELKLHLTVHDELDLSKPRTKAADEALKETVYIMENCIKIKVPIKVDVSIGENWNFLKLTSEEQKELGL